MLKLVCLMACIVYAFGDCHAHECDNQVELNLPEGVCRQEDYDSGKNLGDYIYNECNTDQQCIKYDEDSATDPTYICEDLPAPWLMPLLSKSNEKSKVGYECQGKNDCDNKAKDCQYQPSRFLTKICVGADLDESCETYDCNPGLYCSSNLCKKLKKVGDECFQDLECPLYAACEDEVCQLLLDRDNENKTNRCTTGPVKSDSQGNIYTDSIMPGNVDLRNLENQYFNWFCASGNCEPSLNEGICKSVTTKDLTSDYKICETKDGCTASNNILTECICGDNTDANAICFPELGDSTGETYVSKLREWLDIYKEIEEQGGCLRDQAFTVDCLTRGRNKGKVASSFIRDYVNAVIDYGFGWKKWDSKGCVQNILSKYYSGWEYYVEDKVTCDAYVCANEELTEYYTEDVCLKANETNKYYVKECNTNKDYSNLKPWCPAQLQRNTQKDVVCQEAPDYESPLTSHFPGYQCQEDIDCQAISEGWCNKEAGMCAGLWLDQDCDQKTDVYSCGVGLTCIQQTENDVEYTRCRPFVMEGETGCYYDFHCEYGNGCDRDYNSEGAGVCKKWFSIVPTNEVKYCDVATWESWLCSSGQCEPLDYRYSGKGKCIEAIQSKSIHNKCNNDSDCEGKVGGESSTFVKEGICKCGYSEENSKYCGAFLGDSEGQNFIKELKGLITHKGLRECQIGTATFMGDVESEYYHIPEDCYKRINPDGWKNFRIKEWEYRNSVDLMNKDDDKDECQRTVYNQDYYRLFENEDSAFTLALGVVLYLLF